MNATDVAGVAEDARVVLVIVWVCGARRSPEIAAGGRLRDEGAGGLRRLLFSSFFPLAAPWAIVRHGPFRNRWWCGENPAGFALTVGTVAFLLGFIGPLIVTPGANQGPLLGIFITGPLGCLAGFVWGLVRYRRRMRPART